MATGVEAGGELCRAGAVGSLAAALLLLFCAARTPSKNWLLDYYPNPDLEGAAKVRAWIRRANFEVPADVLLTHVPDRPNFSLRLQSCLPLSDTGVLAVRLQADDRARFYVDGRLMIDSAEPGAQQAGAQGKKNSKREAGKTQLDLVPGTHLITVEYSNTSGTGVLRLELSQPGLPDNQLQSRLQRPTLDGRCGPS